jgi:ubiquinone/menaquinone biosynthesis C-methylase UbiE
MPLPTGRALLDPEKLLGEAGLSIGEHYADFGSGTLGHFAIPGSAMVGREGKVYAVDILKSALAAVEGRARSEGIINLTTVWGDLEHPRGTDAIPEHSVNLVSLINITGLLKHKGQTLPNAKRVLKPGGRLLLVDWKKGGAGFGPPAERRVSPEEIKPLVEAQGFKLSKEFEAGASHWGLLYTI